MNDSLYSMWSGLFEIGRICVHGKMFEVQNKTVYVQLSIRVCMLRFVSELPFIYVCVRFPRVRVYQGQAHVCSELSVCK